MFAARAYRKLTDRLFHRVSAMFGDIPTKLVVPRVIKYYGSAKTTQAEYEQYIDARMQMLGDLEVLRI